MKIIINLIVAVFIMGSLNLQAQASSQRMAKGRVTDAQGQAVAGVQIQTVPAFSKAVSNAAGVFSIAIQSNTQSLVFTKAGYPIHQFSLKGQDVKKLEVEIQAISLVADQPIGPQLLGKVAGVSVLHEVVVVGYGKAAAKRRLTGAAGQYQPFLMTQPYMPYPTESYAHTVENGFKSVTGSPLSTFSIDVDKASYSNIRRMVGNGQMPPPDAVRTEEMINYFDYHYPQPEGDQPINIITELSVAPWNPQHQLLQIGVQGKTIEPEKLPPSNLVFLIDVSGSMSSSDKLPLLVTAFKMLTDKLRAQDRVAIITYAGGTQKVLGSTSGANKEKIKAALDGLYASGSTNGAGGLEKAYAMAEKHFMKNGNNRIILATDGDFNVGFSSLEDLEALITQKRKSGVYLSVLGFGMGNYKDDKVELLADKGNGNYAYIDNSMEAQRVLLKEFGGTLFTIAGDVKIQVEFNPSQVQAYRLIGYENRSLKDEDFKVDSIDAGEMGSGQSVTALYEIIPMGVNDKWVPQMDTLKYMNPATTKTKTGTSNDLLTVNIRYKKPGTETALQISHPVPAASKALNLSSDNFRFSAAVAGLAMLLKNSPYAQQINFDMVTSLAGHAKGLDANGDRAIFLQLAQTAKALQGNSASDKKLPEQHFPISIFRPRLLR